jgi:hypothetical protein
MRRNQVDDPLVNSRLRLSSWVTHTCSIADYGDDVQLDRTTTGDVAGSPPLVRADKSLLIASSSVAGRSPFVRAGDSLRIAA